MKSIKWQTHRTRKKAKNCKRINPSQYATGPKTDIGKQNVSQNALKHGAYNADLIALSQVLYHQSILINKIMDMHDIPR